MLSKEDYQNYLNQIVELERKMSLVYENCSKKVDDTNIKKTCGDLSLAEKRHLVLVQELVQLLTS